MVIPCAKTVAMQENKAIKHETIEKNLGTEVIIGLSMPEEKMTGALLKLRYMEVKEIGRNQSVDGR